MKKRTDKFSFRKKAPLCSGYFYFRVFLTPLPVCAGLFYVF